jgi:glucoamylase
MAIANRFHSNPDYVNNTLMPAILKDLDYVTNVWQQPCFDLWEEVKGVHFYTLMVMRRALLDAIDFFPTPTYYKSTAKQIKARIETFWSPNQRYVIGTQDVRNGLQRSGLDISTLLAANLLASRNDGFFTPGSDKVLATAVALEDAFKDLYPLNQQLDKILGTSIGRYPEDIYDGYDTSVGNPWFIATAAFAELYYLAIKEWKQVGVLINDINRPFFQRIMMNHFREGYYAPGSFELNMLIDSAQQAANKFLATIQYHQHRNGSMSEQFDRYIGYMAGARDLTWSHAAVISAIKAKTGKDVIY